MKVLAALLVVSAAVWAGAALAESVNFDALKRGAPPPGWTATRTGSGDARWTVEADDSAPSPPNVLKQSGRASYPVCIKDDTSLKDGFVEVKFKPLSGREDQRAESSGAPRTRTTTTSPGPTRSRTTSPFTIRSTGAAPRRSAST